VGIGLIMSIIIGLVHQLNFTNIHIRYSVLGYNKLLMESDNGVEWRNFA